MTVLTSIIQSIRNAAAYNQHELAAPRVILWPDEERLWFQCIAPLQTIYPVIWSLGDYCPEQATGPAVWLRYKLETQNGEDIPVIYLPGIDRSAFRSADQYFFSGDTAPAWMKPKYRKDWPSSKGNWPAGRSGQVKMNYSKPAPKSKVA